MPTVTLAHLDFFEGNKKPPPQALSAKWWFVSILRVGIITKHFLW